MEDISEAEHQENREILADLVAAAPTQTIRDILQCYQYDEEGDDIYAELNKFIKVDLQDAANFLPTVGHIQIQRLPRPWNHVKNRQPSRRHLPKMRVKILHQI